MIDIDKLDDLPRSEQMRNPRNKRAKLVQGSITARSQGGKGKKWIEHTPSVIECEVATYLAVLGVEYVAEKTFPDLISGFGDTLLPLDFYLPKHRACIELDGAHHRSRVQGDKAHSLDRRRLNDQLRNLFCKQRGFRMLRIRSDKMENFKELINEFLSIDGAHA